MDFAFSDFLLVVIILTLFHLVNVIELSGIKNPGNEVFRHTELKFQATLTFIAITITIICGLIAQAKKDAPLELVLMLIPFAFIIIWIVNQLTNSNFVNLENFHAHIQKHITDEIEAYAEKKKTFTFDGLSKDYSAIVTIDALIRQFSISSFSKQKIRIFGAKKILAPLDFNAADIKQILKNLVNVGVIKDNGTGYSYIKSLPKDKSLSL